MPVVKPLFELAALDAVSWMRELPTESVDLVVTDPATSRSRSTAPSAPPRG